MDVTFHETESLFPSSQLQGESIQEEAENLELPPFPLLQDSILREHDKDPTPEFATLQQRPSTKSLKR